MLHVMLRLKEEIVADFQPGSPTYKAGDRYLVREDFAGELVRRGVADPLDCPDQVDSDVDVNTPVSAELRAACLARVLALVPAPPPSPRPEEPAVDADPGVKDRETEQPAPPPVQE